MFVSIATDIEHLAELQIRDRTAAVARRRRHRRPATASTPRNDPPPSSLTRGSAVTSL